MEHLARIELAYAAWQAVSLPLGYKCEDYIKITIMMPARNKRTQRAETMIDGMFSRSNINW